MREILFRGKTNDGEWKYGSLHIEYGEMTKDGNRAIDYRILGMCGECYYVIPETIGQYTGLTDKNGKKAFEHDVTEDAWGREWIIFACAGGFGIRRKSEWLRNDFIYNALTDAQNAAWFKETHTVIGNIHDNSELLKGENNV